MLQMAAKKENRSTVFNMNIPVPRISFFYKN